MRKPSTVLALICTIGAAHAEVATPVIPRGDGAACVEPVDVMRRDHMDFLMHQRDRTVHDGVRTRKYSLMNCLSCHTRRDAAGKFIPVNAPGEFCESCHAYSEVRMDCFECHAGKPAERALPRP